MLRRDVAKEISHLYALEQVFDRSVEMLQEEFSHVPEMDSQWRGDTVPAMHGSGSVLAPGFVPGLITV